jgi:hypothetical protein
MLTYILELLIFNKFMVASQMKFKINEIQGKKDNWLIVSWHLKLHLDFLAFLIVS